MLRTCTQYARARPLALHSFLIYVSRERYVCSIVQYTCTVRTYRTEHEELAVTVHVLGLRRSLLRNEFEYKACFICCKARTPDVLVSSNKEKV